MWRGWAARRARTQRRPPDGGGAPGARESRGGGAHPDQRARRGCPLPDAKAGRTAMSRPVFSSRANRRAGSACASCVVAGGPGFRRGTSARGVAACGGARGDVATRRGGPEGWGRAPAFAEEQRLTNGRRGGSRGWRAGGAGRGSGSGERSRAARPPDARAVMVASCKRVMLAHRAGAGRRRIAMPADDAPRQMQGSQRFGRQGDGRGDLPTGDYAFRTVR